MAEIQAEEQKREQLMKQKERERTEREISMVAIEQAKQEKARSTVKMQSWSTVITKNVPQSTPMANNSVWGSSNQMSMFTNVTIMKCNFYLTCLLEFTLFKINFIVKLLYYD